jgi:hypothetical protein
MKIWMAVWGIVSTLAYGGSTEFIPLQQRAQGHSLTGASLLNDSIFANPASSAFTNAYAVDGSFLTPKNFAVSILDTKTSGMGGALAYFRMNRPGIENVVQGAKIGMSGRVSENFGFGVMGKTVWGPDLAGTNAKYTDLDLGVVAQFEVFQLGLSMQNVLGGNPAMGEAREYSFGTRLNWEQTVFFSAAMNGGIQNFQPQQFGFGAEYVSPYYFSLKGGYRFRPQEQKSYWSAGLSILSPRMSIHYAVELPNVVGAVPEHSVGTTFLF